MAVIDKVGLFALLKMVGFVENNYYAPRGDGLESLTYSFGKVISKAGTQASLYGASCRKGFLLDFLPESCIAYVENGEICLSILSKGWNSDNQLVDLPDRFFKFSTVDKLLQFVREVQLSTHERALSAIENAEMVAV